MDAKRNMLGRMIRRLRLRQTSLLTPKPETQWHLAWKLAKLVSHHSQRYTRRRIPTLLDRLAWSGLAMRRNLDLLHT